MDSYAIIFDWQRSTPVYHTFDNSRLNAKTEGYSQDFTLCGRIVSEYNYETQRFRNPGNWFPIQHARKFTRPCGKCFPNGDEAPNA